MLTKSPKPAYKRFIGTSLKLVFLAEALGFAVSYGVWYRLNTDRGNKFIYENTKAVLYYFFVLLLIISIKNIE